jgi:hypothetical protein
MTSSSDEAARAAEEARQAEAAQKLAREMLEADKLAIEKDPSNRSGR